MSRRRRGLLLVGLALVLGSLAAADVRRREAALDARLAPLVPVLVARADLEPGRAVRYDDVEAREVPARWAPVDGASAPGDVAGAVPAVRIPRGAYVTAGALTVEGTQPGAPVRNGERAVEIVAAGSPDLVAAGTRVDVLVTREGAGTRLALQDVEVLAARATSDATGAARIAATLRVTLRQAVFLTAAQSFARELRLLPRAAGDARVSGPIAVGEELR
jgi:pilus assembly protein CpaB